MSGKIIFLLIYAYILISLGLIALPNMLINMHFKPEIERRNADKKILKYCWLWPFFLIKIIFGKDIK